MYRFILIFIFFLSAEASTAYCNHNLDAVCDGLASEEIEEEDQKTPSTADLSEKNQEIVNEDLDTDANNEVVQCEEASEQASRCCEDPSTCLGSFVGTFHTISKTVGIVTAGVGTLASSLGKDIGSTCEFLQDLLLSTATLSVVASVKCKTRINKCNSTCENNIKEACHTFKTLQTKCVTAAALPLGANLAQNEFNAEIKNLGLERKISNWKERQKNCKDYRAFGEVFATDLAQMLGAAVGAEICKAQSADIRDEKECENQKGNWSGGDCILPQDTCKERGGSWNAEEEECDFPTSNGGQEEEEEDNPGLRGNDTLDINLPAQSSPIVTEAEDIPEDEREDSYDPDNVGSGGKEEASNPIGLSQNSNDEEEEDGDTPPPSLAEAGGSGGGGRFLGRRGSTRYPNKNYSYDDDDDQSFSGDGGGGFGGYGSGGARNKENSRARSKRIAKNKNSKNKPVKMKAAGFTSKHQNIFERVTKRFKKLCKEDIKCN